MKGLINRKPGQIAIFLFFELLSIGMGMGVPIFTILYGFFVGLVIPWKITSDFDPSPQGLASILRAAFITSTATLILMALLWLPSLKWLFDSTLEISNFGIPMILYSPRASFIGWLILMVLISPFLQFLMTLFGAIFWIVFLKDKGYIDKVRSRNWLET